MKQSYIEAARALASRFAEKPLDSGASRDFARAYGKEGIDALIGLAGEMGVEPIRIRFLRRTMDRDLADIGRVPSHAHVL